MFQNAFKDSSCASMQLNLRHARLNLNEEGKKTIYNSTFELFVVIDHYDDASPLGTAIKRILYQITTIYLKRKGGKQT